MQKRKKQKMKHKITVLLLSLLLSACSLSGSMRMGTAPQGGVYHSFGIVFSDLAKHEGFQISVKETSGSSSNLRLLSEGYIQLGIAQSDRISHSYYDSENPLQGYSAMASLYDEAVMIIVRTDSDIRSIPDLEDKRISIGEEESGTAQNAREVLLAYGLDTRSYIGESMNYSEASEALADGSISAMFLTASVNAQLVRDLDEAVSIRLLSIDEKILERLKTIYPYFSDVTIPKGTFSGMDEDARTVGVRSILLASDSLPADTVYQLTALLFEHTDEFDEYLRTRLTIRPESALEGISIPVHEGSKQYYEEHGFDTGLLR